MDLHRLDDNATDMRKNTWSRPRYLKRLALIQAPVKNIASTAGVKTHTSERCIKLGITGEEENELGVVQGIEISPYNQMVQAQSVNADGEISQKVK